MTEQEIVAALAEKLNFNQASAQRFLQELSGMAQSELQERGVFRLPRIGTLKREDGELHFRASKALR